MLTKEQILALKPGREMDALIAEHVFRWRKVPGPKTDCDGPCESFDVLVPPGVQDPLPLYPPRGAIKPYWFCKQWSTDLNDSWSVREWILDCVGGVELIRFCDAETPEYCGVYRGKEKSEIQVWASTTPEAICKAALLAEAVKRSE